MRKLIDSIRFPYQSKLWKRFIQIADKFEFDKLVDGEEMYLLRNKFGEINYIAGVRDGRCRIYNSSEECILGEWAGISYSKEMAKELAIFN